MTQRRNRRAITPGKITWCVLKHAREALIPIRRELGEANYDEEKRAIKELFCQYINTAEKCAVKGVGIFPIGSTRGKGKTFKMRWSIAGCGKSGGLRLAVVAYCAEKTVKIAGGWLRKEDPSDDEFAATLKGL